MNPNNLAILVLFVLVVAASAPLLVFSRFLWTQSVLQRVVRERSALNTIFLDIAVILVAGLGVYFANLATRSYTPIADLYPILPDLLKLSTQIMLVLLAVIFLGVQLRRPPRAETSARKN